MDAAAPLVTRCQERFPELVACSFDRGFHSPAIKAGWTVELNACPAKGYRNQAAREREATPQFSAMRRWHSGVESAIHSFWHVASHRDERTVAWRRWRPLHTLGNGDVGSDVATVLKAATCRLRPRDGATVHLPQNRPTDAPRPPSCA